VNRAQFGRHSGRIQQIVVLSELGTEGHAFTGASECVHSSGVESV